MRRVFLLILCLCLLTTAVCAAGTVSELQSNAFVSADGTCQISVEISLTMDGTESDLRFPLPGTAKDITLNGSAAKTSRSDSRRWVDLSSVIYAGQYENESIPETLSIKEGVEEIAESAPELALIFDPANYVQCGQDTAHALDKLAHKTIYFHIKDVISATGELVPAGHGDGNIPKLISMIGREETKVLTIEPHLAVFDAYKSIDQTEMKHKFHFTTPGEAFDFAVSALKSCLLAAGYTETTTGDFVLL